jgi:quinoprotein glucose dehydrogenase
MKAFLLSTLLFATACALAQAQEAGEAAATSPRMAAEADAAAAGKAFFDGSGQCLSCHRVGVQGSPVGPDLSDVGSSLAPEALRQALLAPSSTIALQDRLYRVVMRDGKVVQGKLLNQDPYSIQMLDSQGSLVAFSRSQVQSAQFVDPPPMPSYRGKLTSGQLDNLVRYLQSLRVPRNP